MSTVKRKPKRDWAALKAARRDYLRANGFVLKQLFVYPEDWPRVKAVADELRDARLSKLLTSSRK